MSKPNHDQMMEKIHKDLLGEEKLTLRQKIFPNFFPNDFWLYITWSLIILFGGWILWSMWSQGFQYGPLGLGLLFVRLFLHGFLPALSLMTPIGLAVTGVVLWEIVSAVRHLMEYGWEETWWRMLRAVVQVVFVVILWISASGILAWLAQFTFNMPWRLF